MIEGSRVKIVLKDKKLILTPVVIRMTNGQSGVKVSTEVCGTSGPSSIPGSGPKSD